MLGTWEDPRTADGDQPTVLIVDDTPANLRLILDYLSQAGYRVLVARDGESALLKARHAAPDLILLDILMPGIGGIETCRQLKADPQLCEIPVIFATALNDPEDKLRGFAAGGVDYVTKPLQGQELLARVQVHVALYQARRQLAAQNRQLQQEIARRVSVEKTLRETQADLEIRVAARTADLQRTLQRLNALHTIDKAIIGSLDRQLVLEVLLDQAIGQLGIDGGLIWVLNESLHELECAAWRGLGAPPARQQPLRGDEFAGQVILQRRAILISDTRTLNHPETVSWLFAQESIGAYFGLPLLVKGQVRGILEVFFRQPYHPAPEWSDFLGLLAAQAAVAIENTNLFHALQHSNQQLALAYDATLEGWARALELRDQETEGHARRVTDLTLRLARALQVADSELIHLRRGALLHDIGKMGIPDQILLKAGPLTEEEWAVMRKHPEYAFDLLFPIRYLRPALDIPFLHHERWDGSGYPLGLAGTQIPLAARIFAVVDVWDALTSDRPYRKAWGGDRALAYLQEMAGSAFDPVVVEAFTQLVTSATLFESPAYTLASLEQAR